MGRVYPLIEEGETEQAMILLGAALEVNPDAPPEDYEHAGFLFLDQGYPEKAIQIFEKAILHYPWFAPAYFDIEFVAYQDDGRLIPQSIQTLEKINETIKTGNVYHVLGNFYYYLGDDGAAEMSYHEAKDRYNQALTREGDMNARWNSLGLATMLFYVDEDPERMESLLAETERLGFKEKDSRLLGELGWLFIEMDNCGQAIDLFNRIENQMPDYIQPPEIEETCR
jgi:tetratricopeptide (TPR) repeat protein